MTKFPNVGPSGPDCEKMIFIGNLPDMDPSEKYMGAENARDVLGGQSFGSEGQPLYDQIHDVTLNDKNRDGIIWTDGDRPNRSPKETITHSVSGRPQNYEIDSTFLVHKTNITFLNPDGTTETVELLDARVMQDTAGNTFLLPPPRRRTTK